jgi:hypothetical protein
MANQIVVTSSGSDSLVLSSYIFTGLADATNFNLTFASDIASSKVGKNGNTIVAQNEQGKQAEAVLRCLIGSADDQFMLSIIAQQQTNFTGTVFLQGSFVKSLGDNQGNLFSKTYILGVGYISKLPEVKSDADGSTDQAVVEYHLRFPQVTIAIS